MGTIRCLLLLLCVSTCVLGQDKIMGTTERNNGFTNVLYSIGLDADSLNFLTEDQALPIFLSDTLLDWKRYRHDNLDLNGYYYSYRREVINRVVNINALKQIIESTDKRYDYVYSPEKLINWRKMEDGGKFLFHDYVNLPYQEMTLRQLASIRLEYIERHWLGKK